MPRVSMVCVIAMVWAASPARGRAEEVGVAPETSTRVFSAPQTDTSWRQDVLVALIGVGVRSRRIHLEVGGTEGMEPRDLDTGAYFDFAWHLLVRPFGHRSPRAAMRAMVLQLDGGAGVRLLVEPVGTGISLETNTWRMIGQLGYLYPMGRSEVGGLIGVGGDVFHIDLNSVLPSSRIVYVRLGPAASVRLVNDLLAVRADFGLRLPFHLGAIDDTFGRDTRALGLDAAVTFQGRIKAGFTYALRFVWEYYSYRFAGQADSVPAMAEGGGGQDHAISGQLLLGWSL